MEQRSNTEEISTVVDETKELSDDCHAKISTKTLDDQGTRLDHSKEIQEADFKTNKVSVVKYADSEFTNVGRMITENKMSPLSCHQMVAETERATTQEERNSRIQLTLRQDIQEPTTKKLLADQLKSEDRLDDFHVIPTINAITDDNEKPNEDKAPTLVGFNTDQSVAKCVQEMIDQAIYEEFDLESPGAFQNSKQKQPKTTLNPDRLLLPSDDQANFENLCGPSSPKKLNINRGEIPEVDNASKKSIRQYKKLKKCRNYLDQLSAIIDEVQRMNDYYLEDVLNERKSVEGIDNMLAYVSETMASLNDLTSTDIYVNEDQGVVNVGDYGFRLVDDILSLQRKSNMCMDYYNISRLNFVDACRDFLLLPLEDAVDKSKNVMESFRAIYERYFHGESFFLEFENINLDIKTLDGHVENLNHLIEILGEQRNNGTPRVTCDMLY